MRKIYIEHLNRMFILIRTKDGISTTSAIKPNLYKYEGANGVPANRDFKQHPYEYVWTMARCDY